MQLKDIAEEMQQRSMAARDWVFQVLRTAIIRARSRMEQKLGVITVEEFLEKILVN